MKKHKPRICQKALFNLPNFSVRVTYDTITKHINIISIVHKKRWHKEYDRLYYIKNRKHILQRQLTYQQVHRKQANENHRRWRKANPKADMKYYFKTVKGKNELISKIKENGCAICGYDKCDASLDFHHVNPDDKKFNIARHMKVDVDLIDELSKCVLLCRNCHMEITIGEKIT